MITSPSHAIELLGGPKVVADRLKVPYTTAASWSQRDSIPTIFWPALVEFALEKEIEGFTFKAMALAQAEADEKKAEQRRKGAAA